MRLGSLTLSRRTALGAGVALVVLVVAVAVLAGRRGPASTPGHAWTAPPGFSQVAAIDLTDGTHVALWSGRVTSPKPSECWYLVQTRAGGDWAVGSCHGASGQPWVVRLGGAVAGGAGDPDARFVRVDGGSSMVVSQGYFLGREVPSGPTAVVELLDVEQHPLARYADVPVGGDV